MYDTFGLVSSKLSLHIVGKCREPTALFAIRYVLDRIVSDMLARALLATAPGLALALLLSTPVSAATAAVVAPTPQPVPPAQTVIVFYLEISGAVVGLLH